jgi:hypothetical protein
MQLTDDWQSYEIDVASFGITNLSMLVVPLGFKFVREPQSCSLRNARYEKDE